MRKRKSRKQYKAILKVLLLCLMTMAGISAIDAVYRHFRNQGDVVIIEEREFAETQVMETDAQTEQIEPTKISETLDANAIEVAQANIGSGVPKGYQILQKEADSIHTGSLLQLDSTYGFTGTAGNLTDFSTKNAYYRMKHMQLLAQIQTVNAMNAMAEAYYTESGQANFIVYSTTETYASQDSLYPDFLPDRSTGYCVDLAFLNDDGTISKMTNENNTWLTENAYRFGFILSYTESTQAETGISAAPYHFRYVGKVHAALLHEQNLSLYTYLKALRTYTVTNPYAYQTPEGQKVQLYYVPASAIGITDVPVPETDSYDISGNNTDGYIICVYENSN